MEKEFNQLIDSNKYQVFLFKSRASFPFVLASHTWFVLNKKGEVSRWEVVFRDNYSIPHWGHLYKNLYEYFQGIEVIPFVNEFFYKGKLIGELEGEQMLEVIKFIENSPNTYPYKNTYHLWGPNSNTYIQWVINNFPECDLCLPFNAYGKNYK